MCSPVECKDLGNCLGNRVTQDLAYIWTDKAAWHLFIKLNSKMYLICGDDCAHVLIYDCYILQTKETLKAFRQN